MTHLYLHAPRILRFPDGDTSSDTRTFQEGSKAWLRRAGSYGKRSRYEVTVVTISTCGRYARVATGSGLEKLVRTSELRPWP